MSILSWQSYVLVFLSLLSWYPIINLCLLSWQPCDYLSSLLAVLWLSVLIVLAVLKMYLLTCAGSPRTVSPCPDNPMYICLYCPGSRLNYLSLLSWQSSELSVSTVLAVVWTICLYCPGSPVNIYPSCPCRRTTIFPYFPGSPKNVSTSLGWQSHDYLFLLSWQYYMFIYPYCPGCPMTVCPYCPGSPLTVCPYFSGCPMNISYPISHSRHEMRKNRFQISEVSPD